MRYIGDGKPRTIEKVRATIEISLAVQDRGLGLFTVELAETGEIIGDCGLIPIQRSGRKDRGPEIELGYRFAKQAWGKGYATEAGRAVLAYGWKRLQIPHLLAVTHLENEGSRNVLQKLGFTHQGRSEEFYDTTVDLFSIERPARNSEGAGTH